MSYLHYTCPVFHYALTKYLQVEAQERSLYATSTFPIMHLICLPKILHNLCFYFSWVLQPSQEKLKTMLMQNFWGVNKVHYGKCGSGSGIAFSQAFVTLMPSGLLVLTPRDSAHHQQLTYLLVLTFPISSLKNASKKIHIFFFFAARTGQPPISVLRSRLQQQQLYLY